MNLGALLTATRELLDDTVEPYQWSDESLVRKLNNAVREVCLRARLLKDDEVSCPELCRVPLTTGQAMTCYAPEILVVRHARLESTHRKVWALTAESMDATRGRWQDENQTPGEPTFMVMDLSQKSLRLHPVPARDDTLNLRVWRVPREKEQLSASARERGPVVQIPNIEDLKHWVAHEAYQGRDGETENPQASADQLALFEAAFGARPTLHDMARWADSPPRVRHGHFF